MEIGPRIAAIRATKGLTQAELGERCGMDQRIVNRMENPGYNPTWHQMERIIKALGVSEAEFFKATIPDKYDDPHHGQLHEKLQDILESGTEAVQGIVVNVEWMHAELTTRRKNEAGAKRKAKPVHKAIARHAQGS